MKSGMLATTLRLIKGTLMRTRMMIRRWKKGRPGIIFMYLFHFGEGSNLDGRETFHVSDKDPAYLLIKSLVYYYPAY